MDIKRSAGKSGKARARLIKVGIGVAVSALLVVVLQGLREPMPSVARANLAIGVVEQGELVREVRGAGVLVPREVRWIAAESSARVETILVRPGSRVDSDTVILELSNPEVHESLLVAISNLKVAEAEFAAHRAALHGERLDQRAGLAEVRSNHESARLQAEAESELADRRIVPEIQARRSRLIADQLGERVRIERERLSMFEQTIDSRLAADLARLDQLRSTVRLREQQVDGLKVRAGASGILQEVPVQEGQQVASGISIARVASSDELMAELRIPETQIRDVAHGQGVRIDTRSGVVDGRVSRIDPAVHGGTVLVEVELIGDLPPGARPDLSVDGVIELERLADVLHVARPANAQSGIDLHLFRVNGDDQAARVPVRLGRTSLDRAEVLSGLEAGDRIILSDTTPWAAHDRLRLN